MSTIASILGRLQGMIQSSGVRYIQNSDSFTPATSSLPLSNHDRRVLCKTFKLMDDVVKACQNHRLNLKNSPPFILDILPETYTQLVFIFTQNHFILRDNYYMQIFLTNMQQKCKQVGVHYFGDMFCLDHFMSSFMFCIVSLVTKVDRILLNTVSLYSYMTL
ncbi:CBL proto-oncogene domain 1 [Dictyocaulus viviparus]|uniref:E3 ubiquitin-protein ligase CBL n=1 Tax=Dictyocaulus viviparus TaxID=29172 RepID=A0A0D8XH94_DICVI|nr:CBL proto-oncogene domain 1 [Dictyocaulus viviparus]